MELSCCHASDPSPFFFLIFLFFFMKNIEFHIFFKLIIITKGKYVAPRYSIWDAWTALYLGNWGKPRKVWMILLESDSFYGPVVKKKTQILIFSLKKTSLFMGLNGFIGCFFLLGSSTLGLNISCCPTFIILSKRMKISASAYASSFRNLNNSMVLAKIY